MMNILYTTNDQFVGKWGLVSVPYLKITKNWIRSTCLLQDRESQRKIVKNFRDWQNPIREKSRF